MISRNETFYKAINNSLDFDFKKTLELAVKCRTNSLCENQPHKY